MPINWIDYSIIILYLFVVVYIGWWAMQKVSNFDDYAVAGRGLPMSIFFAAIAATLCGGGATIGRVAFMHTTGIVVFAGLMGVVINQIFSGLYIAGRVHNIKNVYGLGDLFGLYYGHAGRLVSAVVSFLFCLGLFGVQILAMGAILQTAIRHEPDPGGFARFGHHPGLHMVRGHARRDHDRRHPVRDHHCGHQPLRLAGH